MDEREHFWACGERKCNIVGYGREDDGRADACAYKLERRGLGLWVKGLCF